MFTAIALIATSVAFLLLYLWLKEKKTLSSFKKYYQPIIDVDAEVAKRREDFMQLNRELTNLRTEAEKKGMELSKEYQIKRSVFDSLLKELAVLEENLEDISYGLYKPHFDYNTSAEFKHQLERIRDQQKQFIKEERATHCGVEWTVGGSKREGAKMTKQYAKVMLRAFNGECDAAIAKVSWNNIGNMEARIEKAFEAINKLGSSQQVSITPDYFKLKQQELRLEFELEEKIQKEKEEQRRIREQMREEEIAQREIERAQKEAEDEEKRYQKALEKAREDVLTATGTKLETLNKRIAELEQNLQAAHEQKQRAISRAQLTKSGHVYIISNIGSFGEDIYKIGMTRRLEPIDRVRELGDASVPFEFDVHGMIYSENAPELENIFHRKFDGKRINLVNQRREFFKVTLDDIQNVAMEMNLQLQLSKLAEAKEYRESVSLREAKANKVQVEVKREELEHFPVTI